MSGNNYRINSFYPQKDKKWDNKMDIKKVHTRKEIFNETSSKKTLRT